MLLRFNIIGEASFGGSDLAEFPVADNATGCGKV